MPPPLACVPLFSFVCLYASRHRLHPQHSDKYIDSDENCFYIRNSQDIEMKRDQILMVQILQVIDDIATTIFFFDLT